MEGSIGEELALSGDKRIDRDHHGVDRDHEAEGGLISGLLDQIARELGCVLS